MKQMRRIRQAGWILAAGLWLLAAAALDAAQAWERYEVILRREPFGRAPPPTPPPSDEAEEEQESALAPPPNDLRLCVITDTDLGLRVGVVSLKGKPPKTYFLRPGESDDDLELLEADFETGTALLRRDGQQFELQLEDGGNAAPSQGRAPAPARPPASTPSSLKARLEARRRQIAERRANNEAAREKFTREIQERRGALMRPDN